MTAEKLQEAKQTEKEIAWCDEILNSDNLDLGLKRKTSGFYGVITTVHGMDCPDWLKKPLMDAIKLRVYELQEKLSDL